MCDCGAEHYEGANYYASARDGGRTALLAGPFSDHAEALAILPAAKNLAYDMDYRAPWYSYGTLAMKDGYSKPGILNEKLGIERKTA